PGVGPYTAAAIASFAFGERIATVDTNVRRVAARIGATPEQLPPKERHADFNQAAMELGATCRTARAAACDPCPAAPWCAPGRRGRVLFAHVPDEPTEASVGPRPTVHREARLPHRPARLRAGGGRRASGRDRSRGGGAQARPGSGAAERGAAGFRRRLAGRRR